MSDILFDTSPLPLGSGADGFRRFARLISELGNTGATREKTDLLADYFRSAPVRDQAWTLGLFTGRKLRRQIRTRQLAAWLSEWRGIPEWLFEESYHHVGDLVFTQLNHNITWL